MRGPSFFTATAFYALLAFTAPAAAQDVRDHRTQSAPEVRDHRVPPNARDHRMGADEGEGGVAVSSPRYMVVGLLIHCDDETGIDAAGSADIRVIFSDAASRLTLETGEFNGFDTGETQAFGPQQSCISPAAVDSVNNSGVWGCRAGGAGSPLRFTITVVERNHRIGLTYLCGPLNLAYKCASDQVGRETVTLEGDRLTQAMPNVGDTMIDIVQVGGYSITYQVRRLQNGR